MSDMQPDGTERLVKSVERVRDLGEVFTPAATVQAMLDLLPATIWIPHPSPTFLEPACGDGNFLVAILARKLASIADAHRGRILPAGPHLEALQFHALEAISSIYAVDISVDNVIGGTPGHEIGARERLLTSFLNWYETTTNTTLNSRSTLRAVAQWIIDRNILVGNMLPANADGTPSGRSELPLVEYDWNSALGTVSVTATTLGSVMSAGELETTGIMSLFDDGPPTVVWEGPPLELRRAAIAEPPLSNIEARNGTSRRIA